MAQKEKIGFTLLVLSVLCFTLWDEFTSSLKDVLIVLSRVYPVTGKMGVFQKYFDP